MHPQLFFPTSSVFFAILILIHLPTSSAADNPEFSNCSQSSSCANIPEISYPFWGGNRPQYCGHPSFDLNCSGEAATITIETRPYRVLSIDSANTALTVAREEFWNNDCPQYLYNATLDTIHFSYGSDSVDLMLYYNCRSLIPSNSSLGQFSCTANGSSGTFGIYASSTPTTNPFNNTAITCGTSVLVRVDQTESQALLSSSTANLTQVLDSGFGLDWLANNTECSQCVESGGTCGYNTNTVSFLCYCKNQSYSSFCGDNQTGESGATTSISIPIWGLVILVLFVVGLLIFIVTICCLKRWTLLEKAAFWKKKRSNGDHNVELVVRHYGSLAPKRYRYADISKMTNSFKNKLGQGGYGVVYKGKLSNGRLVAVKVLSETKGNGEEFINEVASISTTSHVNVVSLLGFCYERNKRALVYEFMAKGSLDKFIWVNDDESSSTTNCHLELRTLYEIAIGTARGLEYLHRGCGTQIVHFDIKPHNILLDEDFCPKISDFGLAKLGKRKESTMSMVGARGTVGYIAPEVFSRTFGRVSHKSDVYSYGMLVLEVTGARDKVEVAQTSEIYFPRWIYEHLEQGKDLRLRNVNTIEEEEIRRKMILVGLWCIQTLPKDRPPMSKVVEMLEGSLQSLQIPPMPLLSSPARPILLASDSSDSISTMNKVMEVSEGSIQPLQISV